MISRRAFLGAAAVGVAVGLVGAKATKSEASMRFIGRGSSILAMLDTGTERALLVLGEPNERLLTDTAGLTTIGGSRIDLVVATHRILATDVAREHLALDTAQIIVVQTDSSLAPIQGSVHLAAQSTGLALGETTSLEVIPGVQPVDHPDFLVDIECRGRRILLSSNAFALRMAQKSGYDLLVLPGESDADSANRIQPQVFVCNSRGSEEIEAAQIEVFPTDPIVIGIIDDGIVVKRNQLSS